MCLCVWFFSYVFRLLFIYIGFNFMHHEYDVRRVGNKTDTQKKKNPNTITA